MIRLDAVKSVTLQRNSELTRMQFRRLGLSSISNGSQHGLSSQSSSLPSSTSSQSLLLSRFGRREDADEIIQTIDGQHVISHSRLPPGWTVKISSTKNRPYFCHATGTYWPLHCADLVPLAFPVTFQPTCPEPNDSEESEESEDEGMDEGANIDVPAEIVLNLIARGSNSGSTATLEDILRV